MESPAKSRNKVKRLSKYIVGHYRSLAGWNSGETNNTRREITIKCLTMCTCDPAYL